MSEGNEVEVTLPRLVWSELLTMTEALVSEAKLRVNEKGLSISTVDPAHVAMMVLEVPWTAHPGIYEVLFWVPPRVPAGGRDVGLSLPRLKDILSHAATLSEDPAEAVTLHADVNGRVSVSYRECRWKLPFVDCDGIREPKIPTLTHTASATLPGRLFQEAVRGAATVGDVLRITISKEKVMMGEAKEADEGMAFVMEVPAEGLDVKLLNDAGVASNYPVDYLHSVVKAIPTGRGLNSRTKINIGTDYPILIEGEREGCPWRVKYYVAPRVTDD